jgi:cation diffusion facilitator family transporter
MSGSTGVVLIAFGGNIAVAATKFVAAAFTGSTAMLTEGVHSLVDTANQMLLLVGQRRAAKPPTQGHPFGYGMETYFWSFVVAVLILLAGGALSIWEGVEHIVAPVDIAHPAVNFLVLALSALFEVASFARAYAEYRRIVAGSDVGLLRFLSLSKDPSLFGTLLEDGAALLGLAFAAIGLAGAAWRHLAWSDGAASIAIGLLLISSAAFMANEIRSLIAGEAAAPVIERRLREAANSALGPLRMRSLATLQLGPRQILVVITLDVTNDVDLVGWARTAKHIRDACHAVDERVSDILFRPPRRSRGQPRPALRQDV